MSPAWYSVKSLNKQGDSSRNVNVSRWTCAGRENWLWYIKTPYCLAWMKRSYSLEVLNWIEASIHITNWLICSVSWETEKMKQMSRRMTKLTKWHVRPAKTQVAWASTQSDQSAWRNTGSSATHWAHCEDSDQTGRLPRLIWVFPGHIDQFVGFVMKWVFPGRIDQFVGFVMKWLKLLW